jgi:signal transduction histidine kinase
MFRSIRWRLVASHVLLTLLTVSAAGLLGLWGVRYYARGQETRYLTNTAQSIAQRAEPLMSPTIATNRLTQLAQTASFFTNTQVRILDAQGQVLTDSGVPGRSGDIAWFVLPHIDSEGVFEIPLEGYFITVAPGRLPPLEGGPFTHQDIWPDAPLTVIRRAEGPLGGRFEIETLPQVEARIRSTVVPNWKQIPRSERVVRVPIGAANNLLGTVEISSGMDFSAEALASIWPAFGLAGAGALLLAVFLGLLMGGRLSKPVVNLNQVAHRMGAGDLSVRAPVHSKDEIGELAAQFNYMAAQLEASFAQLATERDTLRRFIADASHELRSPITALKNFNELLQGAAADDPPARTEFLAESESQIERLAWITQNLLDLSRLEAGLDSLDISLLDARELVEGVVTEFKDKCAEKSIRLVPRLPDEPVELACDRERIFMALSNLVDNALKYTPHGGEVNLGVELLPTDVRLWVEDIGIGIHPDDLPHVFERFFRGRNNQQPGSGLGLSIVQGVVEAHAGHITVDSQPGEGSHFEILLPISNDSVDI